MGLTQVSKDGVKNDAIDASKLPANSVGASELANNAVDTNAIADQAVALSKLPHGDGSSNGKFLRANNGADPTFESIPAGTTINNNADNRVITGSGSANTLNGESTLTYDGQALTLTSGYLAVRQGSLPQVDIQHSTDTSYSRLYLAQSSGSGGYFAINKIGTNGGAYSGGSNAVQLWQSANAPMLFATNNAERVRILPTGGITFNGDTAAANALDDYEEGTFTAYLQSYYNGTSGQVASSDATYTKIGRKVFVQMRWLNANTNGLTSGGSLIKIAGMPYSPDNNKKCVSTNFATFNVNLVSDSARHVFETDSNGWYGQLNYNGSWGAWAVNNWRSSAIYFYFSGTYIAN